MNLFLGLLANKPNEVIEPSYFGAYSLFDKEAQLLFEQANEYSVKVVGAEGGFTVGKDNVILNTTSIFMSRRAPAGCKDAMYFVTEYKKIVHQMEKMSDFIMRAQQIFPGCWDYLIGYGDPKKEVVQAILSKHGAYAINNFLRANRGSLLLMKEIRTRQLLKGAEGTQTLVEPCRGWEGAWSLDEDEAKPYKSLFNK